MLLEMPYFEHYSVKTIEEALSILHEHKEKATVIAGSTDLLGLMKDRVEGPQLKVPEILVDIKSIPELDQIVYDEKRGLRIGSTVTLRSIETSDLIRSRFSILSQAAHQVGSTQIRNMGTVGGNLCQRPRCMYFRHPHFICYKKGGGTCYAITGEHRDHHSILNLGRCVMAHPSDMATALLALKAKVVISGFEREKTIPIQDFFQGPSSYKETILLSDEIVKEVQVPEPKPSAHQVFLKHRIRRSIDFALSSVATVVQVQDGVIQDVSLVLGGIAPLPYVASKAEENMIGRKLGDELIEETAEISLEEARPLQMNHYKVELTKGLVRRALKSVRVQSLIK